MSVLLLVLLVTVASWAVVAARRVGTPRRSGPGASSGWKTRPARAKTPGKRPFPNRSFGRSFGRDRAGARLLPAPFRPGDLVRVDGEWYHLPTLLRLHRDGRLTWGSPGWRALEQADQRRRERLN